MSNSFPMATKVVKLISRNNKDCIFSNDKKYVIPEYQRDYSWGEEQLKNFVESIDRAISGEKIFMGTVQFAVNSVKPHRYHIIDGQQRMTTFILLCKIIDKEIIHDDNFEIRNFKCNKDNLKNALNFRGDIDNNRYLNNILFLKDEFSDTEQKKILDAIYDNIYFVELKTIDISLPEVVGIFNAINTTGLDLNCSDLFKLQYYEYLKAKCPEGENEHWVHDINKLYEKVNQNENCSMTDILDIYKHCIVAKYGLGWEMLSKSNEVFFKEVLNTKALKSYDILNFEEFEKLVTLYMDFYNKICHFDNNLIEQDKHNKINIFAVNLIYETRYSRYWTIPFIAAYFDIQKFDVTADNSKQYKSAMQKATEILKYLIVCSVNFDKAINPVHTFMCNKIFPALCRNENISDIIKNVICESPYKHVREHDTSWNKRTFIERIQKGLFYNGKRSFIICKLSALLEEIENNTCSNQIKSKLFDWKHFKYDIEHIYARNNFEKDDPENIEEYNGLGNLVVLDRNINRSIGKKHVKEKTLQYTDSQMVSVKLVKKKIEKANYNWTIEQVRTRREEQETKLCDFLGLR